MLATFTLSGYQFTVTEGDVVRVPEQGKEPGAKLKITDVLLVRDEKGAKVGTPFVANAAVEAEVVGEVQGEKLLFMKYRRRTKYRRTYGHRQDYTQLRIQKISAA